MIKKQQPKQKLNFFKFHVFIFYFFVYTVEKNAMHRIQYHEYYAKIKIIQQLNLIADLKAVMFIVYTIL